MLQDLFGQLGQAGEDISQKVNDALQGSPIENISEVAHNPQDIISEGTNGITEKIQEFTPDNVDGIVDQISQTFNNK